MSRILEVNPEDVKELAGNTRKNAEHLLSNKQFNSLHLDASMLGGFPTAQDVVSAHGTAHQVVTSTLQGVNDDLMSFAKYLEQAVDGLGDADDLSATTLGAARHGTSSTDTGEQARRARAGAVRPAGRLLRPSLRPLPAGQDRVDDRLPLCLGPGQRQRRTVTCGAVRDHAELLGEVADRRRPR